VSDNPSNLTDFAGTNVGPQPGGFPTYKVYILMQDGIPYYVGLTGRQDDLGRVSMRVAEHIRNGRFKYQAGYDVVELSGDLPDFPSASDVEQFTSRLLATDSDYPGNLSTPDFNIQYAENWLKATGNGPLLREMMETVVLFGGATPEQVDEVSQNIKLLDDGTIDIGDWGVRGAGAGPTAIKPELHFNPSGSPSASGSLSTC